ncbi:hypothetical protein Y032_0059g3050 [Ancylostoma ceylanicum]|uniref:Reverse transcriptase domain-containing protein n=1 Tax=Ancylostoma ceylanicum TaxID=53326 RepID=A0A016U3Q4_9BILA|nr:hypothetical protein Y032_0059g3050 [Ancylostoma ceylanicum]
MRLPCDAVDLGDGLLSSTVLDSVRIAGVGTCTPPKFAHPVPDVPPTFGPVQPITIEETLPAVKRVKAGKATGPDDMATEVWKSQCWSSADWLTKFFNLVVAEKKVPMDWQQSTTTPVKVIPVTARTTVQSVRCRIL